MLHTDLIFDPKYIDNIISSRKKNIIGIRTIKKIIIKKIVF